MTSKRIFSWSKRQSSAEPYYRTGGLLPIDTNGRDSSNGFETKSIATADPRRLSNLKIIPPDKQVAFSPVAAPYNAALANAASTLQVAFNEMLRSPAPGASACTGTELLQKPLPSRPRSISAPSTPILPAELPGSLLQDNQGFPSGSSPLDAAPLRPISQTTPRGTHPPVKSFEAEGDSLNLLNLVPEPLTHAKSVPSMSARHSTMRSVRSGNALNSSAAKHSPLKVQHKKALNETSSRRRSTPNLITSPSSTDSKLSTSLLLTSEDSSSNNPNQAGAAKLLQPSPLIVEGKGWNSEVEARESLRNELGASATTTPTTRSKHTEELKATITTQDQTISTLQAQFGSLRASHEAHVASLVDTHSVEIASLRNYARVLEEQLARKPSLHHASSNNLLFLLDTTEPPQTPSRESSQHTAGSGSASSITSFQSALEKQQQRSPQRLRNSPEMENLRRKLSTTKRPETASRNLLPELNQYKQNNVALQKQIESLMAKLNESKKSERALQTTLNEVEQKLVKWQEKADKAEKLAKSVQALQNTIDHLENRLEIANIERLDAEEQLFNLQVQKSPFDVALPKLQMPSDADRRETKVSQNPHMSMSTVFSSGSPTSPETESQELSTLATFIAHIERLQDQVRQKDTYIAELEVDLGQLRMKHGQLEQEHNETSLQLDIQNRLLRETQQTDTHIEQLRTAIIDREAIIGEKEKSIRAVERQLEHHKLLLRAEIRRHTAMKLHIAVEDDPLPELTSLAGKGDIDRWIDKLNQRLKKEQQTSERGDLTTTSEAQIESLRQEIDFYIREMIYYKLDIKGYKSDIRKLKRITAQTSNYGDPESDTSSLRPANTPNRPRFAFATPELGASGTTSPILMGVSVTLPVNRPITPPMSSPAGISPITRSNPTQKRVPQQLDLNAPMTPQTPTRKPGYNLANEADNMDPGISPRSVARLSPERRKPTPPSPERERFGDLLTNFPLSTPAAPQRHNTQRSMSDSIIQPYSAPRTPETSPAIPDIGTPTNKRRAVVFRGRSASNSDAGKGKSTPERPPRPRQGLFESSTAVRPAAGLQPSPLEVDILAEAMRISPEQDKSTGHPLVPRNNSNSSSVRVAPLPIIVKDVSDRAASSPLPISPTVLRSRAGSNASSTGNFPIQSSPPAERKLSTASSSSIPFVIAMGSPHNPALITPTTSMPPTACSITRNAPLAINASISRAGVGGTMASSTPITSPTSLPDRAEPPQKPSSNKPMSSTPPVQVRKTSLSKKTEDKIPRSPHTPSHSRNVSGSSIRTAIRLPKAREKEREEAHRMRKDSISMPRPLGSPFGIERSASVGQDSQGEGEKNGGTGYAYGIGEAI
ncbi:uncharacterized protein K460DRAFT_153963 [Cucurbitaria berberidis CBS 394.84]|uniref:Uncharacterized protein n=1 Tax=Cucurbitaria berberidis CBS 394.84 TaxID=1168544 RepID=A0A9P4GDH0_9PLEO|nr:uncharacterized protein K460DRAFT_153963 [Cucurbitaria berberidis CBS 394.84]KAF1843913.1 hypothetical protein K460DRAFT_153963 [Cucurbitaria berberidis CBS 394.84]